MRAILLHDCPVAGEKFEVVQGKRCGSCGKTISPHIFPSAEAVVYPPRPEACGNCQAGDDSIYWNATGGWSCRSCGASDYDEAAE